MSVALDESAIQTAVRRIVERFDPDKVILFGSRARGDAREESDYDLLIVGPSDEPRGQRDSAAYAAVGGLPFSKDVLWYTPEEVDEWRLVRSHFINRALREAKVLYEKTDRGPVTTSRVPPKMPADYARMLWGKARNDLLAARVALAADVAYDTICFHSQQAAEKSLKAVLAMADVVPPRTHDLAELIDAARAVAAEWPFDDERIRKLTRYAVTIRYEREPEPQREEASTALETAEDVHRQTGRLLGLDSPDPNSDDTPQG